MNDATPAATSTPAQREASRLNGAKSRGPSTAEGKAISRLNAMKHGLLATAIMPPGDPRRHDQLYRSIRGELIEELGPSSFSEIALVDSLASDYVQVVRARGMLEAAQRIREYDKQDATAWHTLEERRREARRLDEAITRLDAGDPPARTRKIASSVAGVLTQLAGQLLADEDDADVSDDDYVDPDTEKMLGLVKQLKKLLTDRDSLAALLYGDRPVRRGELAQLRPMLVHVRDAARRWVRDHQDVQHRLERQHDEFLASLAANPEKLMLLARYVARLENAIRKKLRQLQR